MQMQFYVWSARTLNLFALFAWLIKCSTNMLYIHLLFFNNNWGSNLWMGHLAPSPLQKSYSYFMVRFCWNFKQNIFICLPIMIENRIYKWGPLAPPPSTLKMSNSSVMVRFCSNLKPNIFICLPIIIEIKI